jgi:hypothetical protein
MNYLSEKHFEKQLPPQYKKKKLLLVETKLSVALNFI